MATSYPKKARDPLVPNPVTRAIALVGLQEFARRMGVSYKGVRYWENDLGGRIPEERILDAVAAVEEQMTPAEFRPDLARLFGTDAATAA